MKPITREEYYLAKIAGTWQGKTPEPVTIEEYYLATMAGDYSGNTPQPVTRLQYYMAKAAGVWGGSIPAPVTRLEYYWAAIAGKEGHIPDPVTRQEYLLYAISQSNDDVINTASGTTIIINDAAEGRPFRGLRVFGKSTQDGTPTPEAPVPIASAGEGGNITVEVRGKNLLQLQDGRGGNRGVEVTCRNGEISLVGTATETGWAILKVNPPVVLNGDYALSTSSDVGCYLINNDYKIVISTLKPQNIVNGEVTKIAFGVTEGKIYNMNGIKVMLNRGLTASPYEPPRIPQSLTLQTPNGLPGIPVSKDGNYTDADGQQWVCDEIDLERGKYVQRIGHNANVNDWVRTPGNPDIESTTSRFALNIENIDNYMYSPCICNRLSYAKVDSYGTEGTYATINETGTKRIFARIEGITSLEDFRAAMPDLEVIWLLETPIERDLTPEEIAAYKALRTYSPTTVITNDAGAGMEVAYVVER